MNHSLSVMEILDAIKKIKTGKAAVPDGQHGSYYKCFEDQFLQPLQKVVNSILQGDIMLESLKEANILLLNITDQFLY